MLPNKNYDISTVSVADFISSDVESLAQKTSFPAKVSCAILCLFSGHLIDRCYRRLFHDKSLSNIN